MKQSNNKTEIIDIFPKKKLSTLNQRHEDIALKCGFIINPTNFFRLTLITMIKNGEKQFGGFLLYINYNYRAEFSVKRSPFIGMYWRNEIFDMLSCFKPSRVKLA